jgi:hypothetical protein
MRTFSALLLLLLVVGAAPAQVAIVNNHVADQITYDRLRNLLLGRVTTWEDGSSVVLVLSNDEATRKLVEELTGRDLDRLMRGWKRLLFSGNAAMPTLTASSAAALVEVTDRPGAIAIVGTSPVEDKRVRVVPLERSNK